MCERGRSLFMPVHGRHGAECTQRRLRTPPGPPLDRLHRQTVVQDPIHPTAGLSVPLSQCIGSLPSVCLWLSQYTAFIGSRSRMKFYSRGTHSVSPIYRDKTRKRERDITLF